MPNGDSPDHRDIWEALNQARLDIAELKGMIKMHFEDTKHHHPPCKQLHDIQKTMMSALGAAFLALVAAIGSIIAAFIKRGGT